MLEVHVGNLHDELKRVCKPSVAPLPSTLALVPLSPTLEIENLKAKLAALLRIPKKGNRTFASILSLEKEIRSAEAALKQAEIARETEAAAQREAKRQQVEDETSRQRVLKEAALLKEAAKLVKSRWVVRCGECKKGQSRVDCPACNGSGYGPLRSITQYRNVPCGNTSPECPRCGGTGIFREEFLSTGNICEHCYGGGMVLATCSGCEGLGLVALDGGSIDRELVPFLLDALNDAANRTSQRALKRRMEQLSPATRKPPTGIAAGTRENLRTRWFSVLESPTRKGHYECIVLGSVVLWMSEWDGSSWANVKRGDPVPGKSKGWRWRGLMRK